MPQEINKEKAQALYNEASKSFDLGDFDTFYSKLGDRQKRLKLYEATSQQYNLGTWDEFESKLNPMPDEDYDPQDPAFNEQGHRKLGMSGEDFMRSASENFVAYDDLYKQQDVEYTNLLEKEGQEAADTYWQGKQSEDLFINNQNPTMRFNYWVGEMINEAGETGYDYEGGFKDYVQDQSNRWGQVYFKDSPDKLNELKLNQLIQKDMDHLARTKMRKDEGWHSEESYKKSIAPYEKRIAENNKKLSDIRYKRLNISEGNATRLKNAIDQRSINTEDFVKAYETVYGEFPQELNIMLDRTEIPFNDLTTLHDVEDTVNKAYVKAVNEQASFIKSDAERYNDALDSFQAVAPFVDQMFPDQATEIEKFNLLWHSYNKQYWDWFNNHSPAAQDGLLSATIREGVLAPFIGQSADQEYYTNLSRVLEEYADLALLNDDIIDVKSEGAMDVTGRFFEDVGRKTLRGIIPSTQGMVSDPYRDVRQISSMMRPTGMLNEGVISQGAQEQLGEVYDFETDKFKDPGLGDREFWTDTVSGTIELGFDLFLGGKGAKTLLNTSKWGQRLMKLAKTNPQVYKRYAESGKYLDKLANKGALNRALYKASTPGAARAVQTGLNYQAAGALFPNKADELNFATGLFGFFGEKVFNKFVPRTRAYTNFVQRTFGENAPRAAKIMMDFGEKVRKAGGRGIGEVGEENAQQITQLFLESNGDFFDRLAQQYGDVDEVFKMTVASYILGAGFGFADTSIGQTYEDATRRYTEQLTPQQVDNFNLFVKEDTEARIEALKDISNEIGQEVGDVDVDQEQITDAYTEFDGDVSAEYTDNMTEDEVVEKLNQQIESSKRNPNLRGISNIIVNKVQDPATKQELNTKYSEAIKERNSMLAEQDASRRFDDAEIDYRPSNPFNAAEEIKQENKTRESKLPIGSTGDLFDIIIPRANSLSPIVGKTIQKQFTVGGLVPKEATEADAYRENRIKFNSQQAHGIAKKYKAKVQEVYGKQGVPEADLVTINEYLRGAPNSNVNPEFRPILDEMRGSIDALSQELIAVGAVSDAMKSVIQENLGVYVNTSYAKNTNKNWVNQVNPKDVEAAVQYVMMNSDVDEDTATGIVENIIMDPAANRTILTESSFSKVDTGILKQKTSTKRLKKAQNDIQKEIQVATTAGDTQRVAALQEELNSLSQEAFEIAPEIKKIMGEYTNPAYNYLNTIEKTSSLIETHKMLETVNEAGEKNGWLSDRPKAGYSKISGTSNYSQNPLEGKYAPRDIAEALSKYYGVQNQTTQLVRLFSGVNAISKLAKTVYSPGSAVANFLSASLLTVYNGHTPMFGNSDVWNELGDFWKVAQAGGTTTGVKDHSALLYEVALSNGVIDQAVQKNELDQALKEMAGVDSLQEWAEKKLGDKKGIVEKPVNALKRVDKVHKWIYTMGDDFPKFLMWTSDIRRYTHHNPVYKDILNRTKDKKKAFEEFVKTDEYVDILNHTAEIAKNVAPTYSKIPNIVNNLRKTPIIGTFVAFPAEAIRTFFNIPLQAFKEMKDPNYRNIGLQRLAGFMLGSTIFSSVAAITKAAMGVSDEEEEAMRQLAPPWSKHTSWVFLGTDAKGNIEYLDLSRFDTFGYPKQIMTSLFDTGFMESFDVAKDPFITESFAMKTALELWQGKTREGKPIYSEVESTQDAAAKSFTHFMKNVFQTGYSRMATEVYKVAAGDVNVYGKEYSVEDAIAGFVGFREYTINPQQSFYFNAKGMKDRLEQSRYLYYAGRYKDGEEEALEKANEALAREYEEFHKLYNAAIMAGVSQEEAMEMLKRMRISQKNINNIINNTPEVLLSKEDQKAIEEGQ